MASRPWRGVNLLPEEAESETSVPGSIRSTEGERSAMGQLTGTSLRLESPKIIPKPPAPPKIIRINHPPSLPLPDMTQLGPFVSGTMKQLIPIDKLPDNFKHLVKVPSKNVVLPPSNSQNVENTIEIIMKNKEKNKPWSMEIQPKGENKAQEDNPNLISPDKIKTEKDVETIKIKDEPLDYEEGESVSAIEAEKISKKVKSLKKKISIKTEPPLMTADITIKEEPLEPTDETQSLTKKKTKSTAKKSRVEAPSVEIKKDPLADEEESPSIQEKRRSGRTPKNNQLSVVIKEEPLDEDIVVVKEAAKNEKSTKKPNRNSQKTKNTDKKNNTPSPTKSRKRKIDETTDAESPSKTNEEEDEPVFRVKQEPQENKEPKYKGFLTQCVKKVKQTSSTPTKKRRRRRKKIDDSDCLTNMLVPNMEMQEVDDNGALNTVMEKMAAAELAKAKEKERRSISILERSCFSADDADFFEPEGLSMVDFNGDHLSEEEKKRKYRIECPFCGERYNAEKKFARHLYAHTFFPARKEIIPYMCVGCGIEVTGQDGIDRHLSRDKCVGDPKITFPCQICERVFTRKDNLRDHLRVHAGRKIQKRDHNCTFCGKRFGGLALLNIHMLTHKYESTLEVLKCRFCSHITDNANKLRRHINKNHKRAQKIEANRTIKQNLLNIKPKEKKKRKNSKVTENLDIDNITITIGSGQN